MTGQEVDTVYSGQFKNDMLTGKGFFASGEWR